jgi:NADH-quinone oxidoreductase subunit K
VIPLEWELGLSAILFAIGLYGILLRRNAIIVLMSAEIVFNAAILNFVAFAAYTNDPGGQVLALLSISLAAAEAAVGLAIFLVLYRARGSIELDRIRILRW